MLGKLMETNSKLNTGSAAMPYFQHFATATSGGTLASGLTITADVNV